LDSMLAENGRRSHERHRAGCVAGVTRAGE
jgi:hypothetical protein